MIHLKWRSLRASYAVNFVGIVTTSLRGKRKDRSPNWDPGPQRNLVLPPRRESRTSLYPRASLSAYWAPLWAA
jgi:hypothetical protein